LLQGWEELRQEVGCEGGYDSELQGPRENLAVPREVDEIAGSGEDALGALRHFDTRCSEHDFAGPTFDQLGTDLAPQFPDLHRKCGLRHCAIVGGSAEMPVACKRREILQLAQRDHVDKLILSSPPCNLIRPDRPPSPNDGIGIRRCMHADGT
jgi:hypothetical protein